MGHPIFKVSSMKVFPCDHSLKNTPVEQVISPIYFLISVFVEAYLVGSVSVAMMYLLPPAEKNGSWVFCSAKCSRKDSWSVLFLWCQYNIEVNYLFAFTVFKQAFLPLFLFSTVLGNWSTSSFFLSKNYLFLLFSKNWEHSGWKNSIYKCLSLDTEAWTMKFWALNVLCLNWWSFKHWECVETIIYVETKMNIPLRIQCLIMLIEEKYYNVCDVIWAEIYGHDHLSELGIQLSKFEGLWVLLFLFLLKIFELSCKSAMVFVAVILNF